MILNGKCTCRRVFRILLYCEISLLKLSVTLANNGKVDFKVVGRHHEVCSVAVGLYYHNG